MRRKLGKWNRSGERRGLRRLKAKPVGGGAGFERLEGRQVMAALLVSQVLGGRSDTVITGTIYEDRNSDGARTGNEPGVQGWRVYLDLDESGTWNTDAVGAQEPSALTDVRGEYAIANLQAGRYTVAEIVQAGWRPTARVSRSALVEERRTTTVNFFNFAGGDIEGVVWNDLDGDGVRDGNLVTGVFTDPPQIGWTVYVDRNENSLRDPGEPSSVTDSTGRYRFQNIPGGNYRIVVDMPTGWVATRQNSSSQNVDVVPLQTSVQDFGTNSALMGSIVGTIYNDVDNNGVRAIDPATGAFTEPGLAGWTVFLDLNKDGLQGATEPVTVSNTEGGYQFISVDPGSPEVHIVVPDRWFASPGSDPTREAIVLSGAATTMPSFGAFTILNGSIRGTIWHDRFGDGVRDINTLTGEVLDPPLANWQVYLDRNRNGLQDAGEPTTLTDATGAYTFPDLQVGAYSVVEVVPLGWEPTLGFSDRQTVVVRSGTQAVARDFANFDLSTIIPGTVSGTVWHDRNGNAIRDTTVGGFLDQGLSGWVVYVDSNNNGLFDAGEPNATTSATGTYTITGVNPGTVTVREVVQADWRPTNPLLASRSFVLRNNQNLTGQDFGNFAVLEGVIRGTIFADRNRNGLRDTGEPGVVGATVYLDVNNNGLLDAGEQSQSSSVDQFYTPAVDEAGTYGFTHLGSGTYPVRVVLAENFSATPADQLVHSVTIAATDVRTGVDTAAWYRANEIHGTCFDDLNRNHVYDTGESVRSGVTVFVDLDRDDLMDADEPTTVSGSDGSYSFVGMSPGAYVVRQVVGSGRNSSYPQTVGGTLWPSGTSNAPVGLVTPRSIEVSLAAGATHRQLVSLTLPLTGALTDLVDVFLLFDDTGSFVGNSPIVRAAFPAIMTQLQASLPGADLAFGVGRFEEYANFASEFATGRPFILNQPIVSASTPGYQTAIQAALDRTTPGYGGDAPETDIEALYQVVTGRGFDGNNNGSLLDSGAAGMAQTQLNPGTSGDVPPFSSFLPDPTSSVLPASGSLGGAGFRAGALPVILTATDVGFAYQPKGETSVTGVAGYTLPVSQLTQTGRASTPFSYGAGLQETVTALNALGALVIGLGTNAVATQDPRQGLEALSLLTGAVNRSSVTIANGTADPIAPGDPLYFQIATGFAASVADGVVSAIRNAATTVAVDITVRASDPRVRLTNYTGTLAAITSGQTATFDIEITGDGVPHRFDLQFVRAGTNVVMGSIPVVIGTPVPGNGYGFEDLLEGEIHRSSHFGSHETPGPNASPTDVTLSANTVLENSATGTVVGTLGTVDPDVGDSFTYSLVSGATAFQVVGNTLRTSSIFDFESTATYTVVVRSTDAGGAFFDKTLSIGVQNVNEAPTSIGLSANTVAENQPVGTTVGLLSAADVDAGDTVSYSLVGGDSASFQIVGNSLQAAASFNYEAKASYTLLVRATDAGGLSVDKSIFVSVTNVNEAPTSMVLSLNQVSEAAIVGATVGGITTIDPDFGDTFTYALVGGDTAAFTLVGSLLKTAVALNFETKSSYSVVVRSTDAGGLAVDSTLTILVTNVNEAPTDISLSASSVAENAAAGTTVGILATVDPDGAGVTTYALVAGDVGSFSIVAGSLRTAVPLNFEAKSSYSVTIRSTDSGGLSVSRVFTLSVTDVNEPPTAIAITSSTVPENSAAGTAIGTLSATDPDAGDVVSYSLVAGDIASFSVVGGVLLSAGAFDFETKSTYTVTVRATDAGGLTFDRVLSVAVTNGNETPTVIALSGTTVLEGLPAGTSVGALTTSDPDVGDSHTYQLLSGDTAAFVIAGGSLQTAVAFDYATKSSYTVVVRSTDVAGLFFDQAFTITVLSVGGIPSDIGISGSSLPENAIVGTAVGNLSTTDSTAGDTFTYSLVGGDVTQFAIDGTVLRSAAVFNFELVNSFTVTVRTTDSAGFILDKAFTISVTNVNEAPTDVSLSGGSVDETASVGTTVGTLSATDPDSGDSWSYSLVGGDAASFGLSGSDLQTAVLLNHAAKSSYSVVVRATDGGGLSVDRTLAVQVQPTIVTPSQVTITGATIAENAVAGTSVGTLSTESSWPAGTVFDYALVGGDVAAFQVVGSTLATAVAVDFEAKASYGVTVRSSVSGVTVAETVLTISVTDVNESPTGVALSAASVAENGPAGTTVGQLSTLDPDAVDSFMYALVGGDVAHFSVAGNALKTAARFDFETKASYSVTVRATDAGGLWFDQPLTISVEDLGGVPAVLAVPATALNYAENAAASLFNGAGTVVDADTTNYGGGLLVVDFAAGGQPEDRLSVVHQGTLAGQIGVVGNTISYGGVSMGTWNGGTSEASPLTIALEGAVTVAALNALVKRLAFANAGDNPTAAVRQIRLVLTDAVGESSVPVLRSVGVTPVNDRPVVAVSAGDRAYLENAPALVVDPEIVITDADSSNLELGSLTVSFANAAVPTDRLALAAEGSGPGQVGLAGTSVLYGGVAIGTLSGGVTSNSPLVVSLNVNATPAAVQAVARRVTFSNAGDNPTAVTRSVRFVVVDGDGGTSLAVARPVVVTPVNDAPVITLAAAATPFTENAVARAVDSSAVVADPDSSNFDTGTLVVQFASGAQATDRLLVLNGGIAAGRIGVSGSTVTFGGVAIGTLSGGFTDNSQLTVTFNGSATVAAVQALVKAVAYQAIGDDPTGGARVVRFVVSDGDGGTSAAKTKTVNVTAVNDVPLMTPTAGTVSYTENGGPIVVDAGMVVSDPDSPDFAAGTLRVSFASGSVATDRLTILSEGTGVGQVSLSGTSVLVGGVVVGTYAGGFTSNGPLTITWNTNATPALVKLVARRVGFHNTGDNPTSTNRVVSFVETDGDGGTSVAKTRTVAVTAVNDASVLADSSTALVSYTEAAAAVLVTSTATLQDVDSPDFAGGRLTVSLFSGGTLDDLLEIRNVGIAAGQIGYSLGTVTYGGVSIGTATGGSGGTSLVVSLGASATPVAVQALIRNITFRVAGAVSASSSRTIRFVLEDGDGGTSDPLDKGLNVVNLP